MLDNIREWISDNLRYILLALAVILVLIIGFCVFRLISGSSGSSKTSTAETKPAVSSNSIVAEDMTEAQEANAAEAVPADAVPSASAELVKDDSAVLTLVNKYYTACASKDTNTLSTIVEPWNDEVQEKILQNDVIESYHNIATYSKPGLTDGAYVVFAYFEGKVPGIDTLVPSLARLYLLPGSSGSLCVSSEQDTDPSISDYINTVTTESDVQALIADVNSKYEDALASDSALSEYITGISGGSSSGTTQQQAETEAPANEEMTATVDMNIREQPGTDSAIVGSLPLGEIVTVVAQADDGWVQIEYDSGWGVIEGYVRLEYLSGSGSSDDAQTADAAGDTGADAAGAYDDTGAAYGQDASSDAAADAGADAGAALPNDTSALAMDGNQAA